ncbi:uncharacterized protein LOC109847164 [Asparagus officinalis]|uniref:uncharacterized protein LOC109847164 n=1 Tax=Asparagus officinalis TaxID=4686 RepID=UPI00098E1E91|nr:uncharacterized protein LOC109847164 [Asparagus officinalis]
MAAIEEQLKAQVRQEPSVHEEVLVQESSIREEIPEREPVVPPTPPVEDGAADQEAWLRLVERYQKLKAPEFHGSTDSIAAHKWKEDKQRLAAFSLKGDAGGWYRLRFTPEQKMTVSWETFIYLFDEQYVSAAVKAEKELELARLEQGDMSVMDCKSKFMSLHRFTGMWHTEERQAQMFLMGLRPGLRRYIVSQGFRSDQEVADAAMAQETDTAYFIKGKDNGKSGQPEDKGKGKRPFGGSGGPHQQSKGPHQQGPHKKGHQQDQRAQQQCRFQGACYNCNKIGHRAAECRSAPTAGQQGRTQ